MAKRFHPRFPVISFHAIKKKWPPVWCYSPLRLFLVLLTDDCIPEGLWSPHISSAAVKQVWARASCVEGLRSGDNSPTTATQLSNVGRPAVGERIREKLQPVEANCQLSSGVRLARHAPPSRWARSKRRAFPPSQRSHTHIALGFITQSSRLSVW